MGENLNRFATIEARRAPTFRWTCGYMGATSWIVSDETGTFEMEEKHSTCDYERKIYNGGDAEYQRNVVDLLGTVRRRDGTAPLLQSTVEAFNVYRAADHARQLAQLRADPARYGDILDSDHPAPAPARGVYFHLFKTSGRDWRNSADFAGEFRPIPGAPESNGADIRVTLEDSRIGADQRQTLRDLIAGLRHDWSVATWSWQISAR